MKIIIITNECVSMYVYLFQVYLSHNLDNNIPSLMPTNLRQVRGAVKAKEDGFILADGSQVTADSVIYCTGVYFCVYVCQQSLSHLLSDLTIYRLMPHLCLFVYVCSFTHEQTQTQLPAPADYVERLATVLYVYHSNTLY